MSNMNSSMNLEALINQAKNLVSDPKAFEAMLDAAGISAEQKKAIMTSLSSINSEGSLNPAGLQAIWQIVQDIVKNPNANLQGLAPFLHMLSQQTPNENTQKNLEMLLRQLGNRR
ncbi:MAG: hypothetical protein HPY81_08710 [Firmicutes bacterium]|nr:hypothetical protein [Bacillota bacterium]